MEVLAACCTCCVVATRNGSHVASETLEFINIVMLCKIAPFLVSRPDAQLFLCELD